VTQNTTQVLDPARGRPGGGVRVALERGDDDGWAPVATATTDADGRAGDLGAVAPGQHRLTFDTGALSSFYPRVVIHFTVAAGEEHYHVPLLLSPYGYSTYRGS
jgi:5-hydroxyisourate hydrolase